MNTPRMRIPSVLAIALIALATSSALAADHWVTWEADRVSLEHVAGARSIAVAVEDRAEVGFTVTAAMSGLRIDRQEIAKVGEFVTIDWPDAQISGAVGSPALPIVRRLFLAPPGARVDLSVELGEPVVLDKGDLGGVAQIMPRQAPIPKIPGAKEAAVFEQDAAVYLTNADLPAERASIEELGIVRGQRLWLLELYPVAINPAAGVLTVYPKLEAHVEFDGALAPMHDLKALPGLHHAVVNPSIVPTGLRTGGNYLIAVASAYQTGIASFATAKQAQGFNVTTYVVPAGATNTSIKTYIQNQYNGATPPDYVLLVGDTDTIPHFTGGGDGSPATDLSYVCMDGATDWYPDIAIGRFSVRSAADLQAIVNKTLYYENGPLADPDYLKRAVFMASTDNYTISEGTHNWVINNHMIPNGITSDKLYTVTYNATTADVHTSFNAGRFYGIYSGHGGTYSWADGPAFSQTDVNNLQNADMYPFVCSFACITGTYTADECFTETWSRAANKGSIAIYGSSVNSYWTEDDVLEKRLFDVIFDETDAVPSEVGPVWNETRMRYLAEMGSSATTRRYFEMYNLLGDPSLRFPGSCSDAGTVVLDRAKYACASLANVTVNDCGLNTNDGVVDTVVVAIDSDSETGVEQMTLIETDAASAEFTGSIALAPTDNPGVLLVAEGDTVTVTYIDADDGQGGVSVIVTATGSVDCSAPLVSNVRAENVEARNATVRLDADEPVRGTVHYGGSCSALTQTAEGSGYQTTAAVDLTGLTDNTTYYYMVDAEDEAGNSATDDNGGACYTFTTPEIPDFFTELFDASDNDLDNISLVFTPNGSNDFYAGCAEPITSLPTDPSGGTTLSLSDDAFATVTLSGGAMVSLYGVAYNTFYPVSNGYITFVHGDDGYGESYDYHFGGVPKISALLDDLNPGTGTTISWKQMIDCVAVTWENIPEYNSSNSNTFQIVMYFDGTIEINFLNIDAADGLAGLSDGSGTDPDFLETDLSGMGNCGPQPPIASNGNAATQANTPVLITLVANDDGLPDPPAAIDYTVVSLPDHGALYDTGGGLISAVPYTLLAGGNVVEYVPGADFYGGDSFDFVANDGGAAPDGGDSNQATVNIQVIAHPPVAQSISVDVDQDVAETIQLVGVDPDGDVLDFVISALPAHGELSDPLGGPIAAAPYTLAANGQTVVYTPAPGYLGDDSFNYHTADGIFDSQTAAVSILVIAPAPQITTATIPDGQLNQPYGPVQLAVSGGQPQVSWSLVTEIEYTEIDLGTNGFQETGVAQAWNGDDRYWDYNLPFSFEFYGQMYSSLRVWSNGFLNFGAHTGSSYSNSAQVLQENIRIAPMWDDLKTTGTGEDIFIDESVAGAVTIRWKASGYGSSGAPANFSVTLMEEGRIRFDYGDGNTPVTPTVGISDGSGTSYVLSMHDGATSLTRANSVMFKLPDALPPGLSLSTDGVISGTPTESGVFEPTVRVADSLGREDDAMLTMAIHAVPLGDCDGDHDGDVDLADYCIFQRCFTGSGEVAGAHCDMFHADGDGDIDMAEYARFVTALEN